MEKEKLNDIEIEEEETCKDLTEETEEEKKVQKAKTSSVSTDFEKVIKSYLDDYSLTDTYFKEKYDDSNKNIRNCCNYIVNEVQKMGVKGLTDDEVYQMARHYYLEDIDSADLTSKNCKVVVNKSIATSKPTNRAIADKAKENGQLDIFSMLGE